MKKEQSKKLYVKEIVTTILFFFSIIIYLNLPFKITDIRDMKIEIVENNLIDASLYLNEEVDFSGGYKNSFFTSLPFSQIIEFKKQYFIYNLSINNQSGIKIPNDAKDILTSINSFNSLKGTMENHNNVKYKMYQFLGFLTVLFIISLIYLIIKFKRPRFLSYYLFILGLFYITNLVFLNIKLDKEKLIEKTLKESYVNGIIN